jgi:muramoyltetrapeptide carboxypeptidase
MTTRAEFLNATTMLAATLASAPAFPHGLRKPRMLRRGDLVGMVTPASPLEPGEIAQGVAHMEALGLRVRVGAFANAHDGFLAGTDEQRASDFNAMARDPHVRAIVAFRGGYGTMRILDALDYDALRRDPKVVLGFSDITAILNAVTRRSGIVTFHGPVAARDTSYDAVTRSAVARALMQPEPIGVLSAPGIRTLVRGRARGPLAGGNLSLVAALTGTPYAIAAAGAVLFLEETNEEPYRVDRMLTQLRLAGTLEAANGVVFGQCTHCEATGDSGSIESVLSDRIGGVGRPAIAGVPVGHIEDQWILPIGISAELDADARTLTVLESGVSA